MVHDERIREQAIDWAVRTGEPDFADWDDFTVWLELDPAHSAAYDSVSAAIVEGATLDSAVPRAANDEVPAAAAPRAGWAFPRRWLGGAIAASLAVVAMIGFLRAGGDSYTIETAPGEQRMIALANGDEIELAGGSLLVLDREDQRFARLERGQALFDIVHDEARPFRLEAGGDRLVDAGTVFDVALDEEGTSVAVAEGAILFDPGGRNVRLEPGDRLTSPGGSSAYQVTRVPLDQVGEWRSGRLTFEGQTLTAIAGQLRRATGIAYRAAPESGGRILSGSVLVSSLREDPRAIGPLLGVSVQAAASEWVIGAP